MDRHQIISWDSGKARVTGFATSGPKSSAKTTIRVDIEVTDAWTLGDLMRDLHELKAARPAGKDGK